MGDGLVLVGVVLGPGHKGWYGPVVVAMVVRHGSKPRQWGGMHVFDQLVFRVGQCDQLGPTYQLCQIG